MKNKRRELIFGITEGAIYVAIYGLIAILTRFLFTGIDSLVYYLIPIPMAIYTARRNLYLSLPCFAASVALSFLLGNPLYVLVLTLPNIFIGLIFGLIAKYFNGRTLLLLLITFTLCAAADLGSMWFYEATFGVSYFGDVVKIVEKILSFFDLEIIEELILRLVNVVGIVTILVDSVVKALVLFMVFSLIVIRLKLYDFVAFRKSPIKYSPIIAIIFILIFILFGVFANLMALYYKIIYIIAFVIFAVALFVMGLYLVYQTVLFITIKAKNLPKALIILFSVLALIAFPFAILWAIILNFRKWDYIGNTFI